MVIIGFKAGQLANRLFAFSHFIANAIEYDYTLINPTFDEYRGYFTATSRNDFGRYRISLTLGKHHSLLQRGISILKRRYFRRSLIHSFIEFHQKFSFFDLNDRNFLTEVKGKKIIVTYGWNFRDFKNFEKHSNSIRAFFEPVAPHREPVETLIRRCKRENDILVGVHMRRGDYKEWKDGIHYYNDDVYYDKMSQMKRQLQTGEKNVSFLLCSNETIERSHFESLDVHIGTNHLIEDLYSLSLCDYIIGPPSTYSLWASFYGKVPYFHITDPKQEIEMTHFTINCG